ncbi:MAG: hypothetical protein KAJ49_04570 [Arcobacteraceae bacterium]|nr:hypothetical protein [Arcobacteraceae bacterium]
MVKRLTAYQKEEREVNKVVQKIKKFEKSYPQNIIERGCARYKNLNYAKRTAEKRVKELQKEIEEAKQKLRK